MKSHPYNYGKKHFKHVSIPSKNLILFHDEIQLENVEDLPDFGNASYLWRVEILENGNYEVQDTFISAELSHFLQITGQLAQSGDTIQGIEISFSADANAIRNPNVASFFQNAFYDLYAYGQYLFVDTTLQSSPAIATGISTTVSDPSNTDIGFPLPNMLDALVNQPFTYYLFVSDDGFKINRAYENTQPSKDNDVIFYLESKGDANTFGSVARLKSGDKARSVSDFSTGAMRSAFRRFDLNVASNIAKIVKDHLEAKKKGLSETATLVFDKTASAISTVSTVVGFPTYLIGEACIQISKGIFNNFIANENRRRYYQSSGKVNPNYDGLIPAQILEGTDIGNSSNYVSKVFKELDDIVLEFQNIQSTVIALSGVKGLRGYAPALQALGKTIGGMGDYLSNLKPELAKKLAESLGFSGDTLVFTNALFVGLWNSLWEIIRGVLDLIAMLIHYSSTPQNFEGSDFALIGLRTEMMVELIENLHAWFKNLFTQDTAIEIGVFYVSTMLTISNAVTDTQVDRLGYVLGFTIGLIAEEVLSIIFTTGAKTAADVAQHMKKSLEGVLAAIEKGGELVRRGQRRLTDAAVSLPEILGSINALIRLTSDPNGVKTMLDTIRKSFEAYIKDIRINFIIAGQAKFGGIAYSNVPIEEIAKLLGRIFTKDELVRLNDLGITLHHARDDNSLFIIRKIIDDELVEIPMPTDRIHTFFDEIIKNKLDDANNIVHKAYQFQKIAIGIKFSKNKIGKFKKHVQQMRTVASKMNIEIPKKISNPDTQEAIETFILQITMMGEKRKGLYMTLGECLYSRLDDAIVVQKLNGEFVTFILYSLEGVAKQWDKIN